MVKKKKFSVFQVMISYHFLHLFLIYPMLLIAEGVYRANDLPVDLI